MDIQVTSTTDSPQAVRAAMGITAKEETPKTTQTTEEPKTELVAQDAHESVDADTEQESKAAEEPEATDSSDEDTDSKDADEDSSEEEQKQKPKKKGGFQKRIERISKQLSAKEQELAYWKEQALKQGKQEPETKAPKASDQAQGKPKAEDFESHADYIEALTDWKVEQKAQKLQQEQEAMRAKESQNSKLKEFQAKVEEFKKTVDDFDDVIAEVYDVQISLGLQEAIRESDLSAQLLYELAKQPDELMRINSLSPFKQAIEVGKLEAKLQEKKAEKKQEIKETKAPPPLKPVTAKGIPKVTKSVDDMTYEEYKAWRAKNKG